MSDDTTTKKEETTSEKKEETKEETKKEEVKVDTPSSPEAAFKALCDDKNPINWIMLYSNGGKLAVHSAGAKGLEEFRGHFKEECLQWGCIKVLGVDQQQNVTSKRPKYVQVSYVGKSVKASQRGPALQLKKQVADVFKGVALTLEFSECAAPPPDLTMKKVGQSLLASGGAHKPTHYDFGNDEKIDIKELDNK
jgi:hypothetical protein